MLLFLSQGLFLALYFLLSSGETSTFEPVLVLCLPFLFGVLVAALGQKSFAMTFFAVLVTLAGLGFLPGSSSFNALYVGLLAVVFVAASFLFRLTDTKGAGRSALPKPFGSLFLILAVALFSSTFLAWTRGLLNIGLISGVLTFLLSGLVVYLVPDCVESERRVREVVHAIVIAATVTSVLWLPTMLSAVGKRMAMPFQSVGVGLNEVGGTLAMLLVLAVGLLVSEEKHSRRLVLITSLLVLTLGLIFTKSRGAWLGSLAGLAYILIRTKRFKVMLFSLAAIPLVASFLEPVKVTLMTRLSQTEAGDPSWLGRLFMWKTALQIIPRNFLLGIGLHNFGLVKYAYGFPRFLDPLKVSFYYRPSQALFGHTHNLYIEMLMDLGIFGFAALFLVLILTIAKLNKIAGSTQETRLKGPALGLAALLIVYMTHSLFDYLLWMISPPLVLATFLGISLTVMKLSEERSSGNP